MLPGAVHSKIFVPQVHRASEQRCHVNVPFEGVFLGHPADMHVQHLLNGLGVVAGQGCWAGGGLHGRPDVEFRQ